VCKFQSIKIYVEVCLTKWHMLIPLRVIHFLLNIVPSEVMISWCCVLRKTVLDFIEVLSNHLQDWIDLIDKTKQENLLTVLQVL